MEYLNIKVALTIILVIAVIWFGSLFERWLKNERYQISSGSQEIYRLDKSTGKIELFLLDLRSDEIIELKEYRARRR